MTSTIRERIYLAIIVALLLVTLGMAYKFIVAGSTTTAADGRTAIVLAPGERDFVLREMRGFLVGLQGMADALSRNDMPGVAAAARALGTPKTHDVPIAIMGKLPLPFKRLAFGVHGDFDAIAAEAERGARPERTLDQLSQVLRKCTACHESYRFTDATTK
jgi:hypothetical protein